MPELPSLRHLEVSTFSAPQPCVRFAAALPKVSSLQSLRIIDAELGSEGLAALGRSISGMPHLSSLSLSLLTVCGAGAAALAKEMMEVSGLVEFEAAGCELSSAGVRALCPALNRQCGLTYLSFADNDQSLDGQAIAAFGPVLATVQSLRFLWLTDCGLGDSGVRALLPYLAPLTQLTRVKLHSNRMSREFKHDLRSRLRFSKWMLDGAQPFEDWDS
jgi:Ran GTPase-activating protein (RanGAP) involved in mRNA processing and transport